MSEQTTPEPQVGDYVELKVRAKLIKKPGTTSHSVTMAFDDCIAYVHDDDGNRLGEVGGRIGASYELKDNVSGTLWRISPRDFWAAFQTLLVAQGLKSGDEPGLSLDKADSV